MSMRFFGYLAFSAFLAYGAFSACSENVKEGRAATYDRFEQLNNI